MSYRLLSIFLIVVLLIIDFIQSQSIISRIPLSSENVKGWIELKSTNLVDELDVKFNLNFSLQLQLPVELDFSIAKIPFLLGEEKCDFLATQKFFYAKFANFTAKNRSINETALLKRTSHWQDIIDRSLILKIDGKVDVCANILIEDTEIFESRFYGPELGGKNYYFLHTTLQLLKIFSLVVNANNFDLNLKWSLRKYWWLPRQDSREPSVALCREKSKNAYFWHQPNFDENSTIIQNYLKPETRQLFTIENCTLTLENLARSVLVVDKVSTFSWDAKKSSCAKLNRVDPTVQSQTCSTDHEILILEQKSPFHPIQVYNSEMNCSTTDPLYRVEKVLKINNRLSLMTETQIDTFVTNLRFKHSNVAVVKYFFPFAGEVRLEQSQNDSDSFTLVSGRLISLFDESEDSAILGRIEILKNPTFSSLNDMSCLVSRDSYNPGQMDQIFCQKSASLCPVGKVAYSVRVAPYNSTPISAEMGFKFVAKYLPLDGPFSVVGQSLKITTPNVESCANISMLNKKSSLLEQRISKLAGNKTTLCELESNLIVDEMFDPYISGVVANFRDQVFNGAIYLAQYIEDISHALPLQNTGLFFVAANNMQNTINVKDFSIDICDRDFNGTCDTAPIYNPFGIDTEPSIYDNVCLSNPLLCALGDMSKKYIQTHSHSSLCYSVLPVRGAFSVSNKTLRLSRRIDGKVYSSCSILKPVHVKETVVRADKSLNSSQIQGIINDELKTGGDLALKVEQTKVKRISSKCQAYRISFLGPDAKTFEHIISQQIKNKTGVSGKFKTDQCVSSGLSLHFTNWSILAPLIILTLSWWCFSVI